jgi:hypothetical protein
MRHFLCSGSIAALPLSVGVTTGQAALVAATSGTYRKVTGVFGTLRGAITLATITVAAYHHRRAAAGTEVASSG